MESHQYVNTYYIWVCVHMQIGVEAWHMSDLHLMIEAAATVLSPVREEGGLFVYSLEMSWIETNKNPTTLSSPNFVPFLILASTVYHIIRISLLESHTLFVWIYCVLMKIKSTINNEHSFLLDKTLACPCQVT